VPLFEKIAVEKERGDRSKAGKEGARTEEHQEAESEEGGPLSVRIQSG